MQDNLLKLENQIPPCSHCNGREFFTERKDYQIGAYCQSCRRWIKWISKSLASELGDNFHSELIDANIASNRALTPDLTEPATEPIPTPDLTTRIERLESEISKINRELLVYNRIFGANRGPRTVQEFQREITDDHIQAFSRAVGDGQ